jgi:hypothetical protein
MATTVGQPASNGPGRPPLVPGEPSIPINVSVEQSVFRRLRAAAQARRQSIQDLIREELRELSNNLK